MSTPGSGALLSLRETPQRDCDETGHRASPEIAARVSGLEATRWTGRPGYPIRSMIEIGLAKSIYAVPTWTRTVALVREHAALRAAVDWSSHDVASVYACYRFSAKRRQYSDTSARCIDRVTARLGEQFPEYDRNVAIDGCDMPAHWNGQRFYGYKLDMAVCPAADLPLAWNVPTARYDG